MHSSQQQFDPGHEPPRESMGFFFRAAIVIGAAFVITILALVSLVYSDPQAPPVRFLNAYGGRLIAAEVVLLLAAVLGGMIQDRPRSKPNTSQPAQVTPHDDRDRA
jgi:hypothetical protein